MTSIAHIGILVADLEECVKKYSEILGIKPRFIKNVEDQNVRVAIFPSDSEDSPSIELLTPLDNSGKLRNYLEKKGEGLHHVAIKTSDLEKKLLDLKVKGFRLIDEKPRIGVEGCKIAFIHPASCGGVLIELVEDGDSGRDG